MGPINEVRDQLLARVSLQIYLSIYYGYLLADPYSILYDICIFSTHDFKSLECFLDS